MDTWRKALDSEIISSASLPGYQAVYRDPIPVEPSISEQIQLTPAMGVVQGSSTAKVKFAMLDAELVNSKYALHVVASGGTGYPLTSSAPANASVGVATTAVLASNANRKGCVIVNDSTATVYLSFGANAELNKGIRLNSGGGSFEMSEKTFNTSAINGIATGAGSNVTVQEWTT